MEVRGLAAPNRATSVVTYSAGSLHLVGSAPSRAAVLSSVLASPLKRSVNLLIPPPPDWSAEGPTSGTNGRSLGRMRVG